MQQFLDLREFLMLPTDGLTIHDSARSWVDRYEKARLAWEKWGDAGPPVGAMVLTNRPGFGGGAGQRLEVFKVDDRYIWLRGTGYTNRSNESICDREVWWRDIRPLD